MDPRPRSPPPERRDRITSSASIEIKKSTPRERDRERERESNSPRGEGRLDSKDKSRKEKKEKDKDKIEPTPVKDLDIDDRRSRRHSGIHSPAKDAESPGARSPGPKSHKKLDLLRGVRERSNSLPMLQASPMIDESSKDEDSSSKRINRRSSRLLVPGSPARESSRGSVAATPSLEDSQDDRSEKSEKSDSGSVSTTPANTPSASTPMPGSPGPNSMLVHRSPRPDGKVVVSSGTVDELIQQLATDQMPDKEYLEHFLLSHPYFLDSVELLMKLLDRFFDPEQSGGSLTPLSASPSSPPPSRLGSPSPSRSAPNLGKQSRIFIQLRCELRSLIAILECGICLEKDTTFSGIVDVTFVHAFAETSIALCALTCLLRVVNAIKKWIELNIDDWDRPELQKQFTQGIERMRGEGGHAEQWATHLTDALKRSRENRTKPPDADVSKRPKPMLPKNLGTRAASILDFSPVELARQITLVEHEMFRKIPIGNFYHKSWASKDATAGTAINLLIKRFNTISYWVSTEVVTLASHKQRSAMIGHFIEMAHAFADLNNYNGLMEMLSGLNMTPVQRLKLAWAGVEPRYMKLLDNLNKLMDPLSNWQVYRQSLKDTNPPCLPFMGLFLTDLTFIEENASHLANGFVNFDKMSLLGKIFVELRRCQSVPYNLEPVIPVQEFIGNAKPLDEDALYESSKKCEPSASSAE